MFGKLILLGLVALAQSRPQDEQLASVALKCPLGESQYLIPNERDCSKFYVCGLGRSLSEGICEPGLEFSVELQRCADPEIAKCNCNPESEEEVVPPSAPQPAPEPEEEREIIYLPNGCPEDMHVPQLLPHEEQCDLFYHCDKGEKVLKECAPGTYFVNELQTCDHIWKVDCISNGTTTPRTTTTTEAEESREVIILPNGCPADFGIYHLLPHDTICSKFYYCVHGEKVERDCAPGTLFNPAIMNCDHAWNVDCEDVTTECICEEGDEDCDGTTTTEKPQSSEKIESAEKEESGENIESAEKEESGEKIESAEKEESGEKIESAEKEDSDEKIESAEKEESSEKIESAEKEESGEKGESVEKEESAEKEESNENQESGETGDSSCEDSDGNGDPNECNCGEESQEVVEDTRCKEDCHVPHWAHESDCDKFWRCVGEEKVLGVCSEGLHFNVNTQTCDFICNAGCKRHEVQSTANQDGLKLFLPWDKVDELFRDVIPKSAKKFIKKRKN